MNPDNNDQSKLFVGGLSYLTTSEKLKEYFSEYGEVEECLVMKNNETGKSRGFGFVTFRDPKSVKNVLSKIQGHQLDGRTIDPKECNPKNAARSKKEKHTNTSPKVFLGGLPPNITETGLRDFFSKYGRVTEVIIMYDQEKMKSRGFGFLSFEGEDAINKVVADHYVNINGKQVEVKRAEPQHTKTLTPAPNGNAPSMPMPFYAVTPYGLMMPVMSQPMNGVNPVAMNYNWNHSSAAVAAAAAAAAAACSAVPPGGPLPPVPGFGFGPMPQGWPPYGQSAFANAPNNSQAAGTAGAPVPPPAGAYLQSGNGPNMNQNVANSNLANIGAYPHQQPDAGNFVRNGANNFAPVATPPGPHNTHNLVAYGQSFGGGAPSGMQPPPPGAPPLHPNAEGAAGMHQNTFNNPLQSLFPSPLRV